MKKSLLSLFALLFWAATASAQITYEDFEGGAADLPWVGANGTYNGAVANPNQTGINTSAFVGSYLTNAASDFNFAIANLPAAANLSTLNSFKVKIWSPVAPSKCLFKLEGSGPAVEKFADITVANQWVEYTFDLSAGAENTTGLTKMLISFHSFLPGVAGTFYWDDIRAIDPTEVIEDFDGGMAKQPWAVGDGTYNGVVLNPDPNKVNAGSHCGSYTKSGAHSYSLFLAAPLTKPVDLTYNKLIKMKLYAGAPTQVLFKLEGGTGANYEQTKNIALSNVWQEYTFDFSGAAGNNYTKLILFFDPGTDASADTYLFDDIVTVPKGICSGVASNPDILDDFECNRNATYSLLWDSLSVVNNPNKTADNNSSKVGRLNDPLGEPWLPMVIDYQNPIDLSKNHIFEAKIWSPIAGKILFKLEGGVSPAAEKFIDIPATNTWVSYKADFSSQAAANHKKVAIFFNAGVDGTGEVFYIDDLRWSEPTAPAPLETFETLPLNLFWHALNDDATLHGVVNTTVSNPNPTGINTSTKVACYAKGASGFSTLEVFLPAPLDLSKYPQLNLDVLSPTGLPGGKVLMQLGSSSAGNKEVTRDIKTPGEWETVSFDFTDHAAITDFNVVRLLFNPGMVTAGQQWCVDNLGQGKATVDPCEGILPIPNIVDDFECQRNYAYGGGSDKIKVVGNPKLNADNSSLKVGEYSDPENDPWAALGIESGGAWDLSVNNFFLIQVMSATNAPILFKLEGGTSPGKEVWLDYTKAGEWQKFVVDFSSEVAANHARLAIFFNGGNSNPETKWHVDNLRWRRGTYSDCIDTHEAPGSTIANFKYFANGHLEVEGYQFEIVDNPNKTGINTSAKVGKFIKASDGASFAGMYADLEAPIDWKGAAQKLVRAKVHMDHIGNFAVKVEGSATGANPMEVAVANTKTGEWEELTYDFSAAPNNAEFQRLTVFFDLPIDATGTDVTSYFDEIFIGDGSCTTVGIFNPLPLELMAVSPNPVENMLTIEDLGFVKQVAIMDIHGRMLSAIHAGGEQTMELDVALLPPGVYLLAGYDRTGQLVARARFVKE